MEGSQGAWAAFNLGARVRITVSHNRSKEEVKQSVDRSFNDLFEGIVVPPLGFGEERKSWQGNTLTFSLSAKMGLVRTPIKGTVEVTDRDLSCSVLMSLQRTISRWMKRAPRDAEPARRWLTFLRNHREAIAAMDFFTVPTITFSSLYCFFVISHDRRRILHFNITKHPTSSWIVQQLRGSLRVNPLRTSFESPWQNGVAE